MGGRPDGVSEGLIGADGVADAERAWASAIVVSARWMDCWRVDVLVCRVVWRVFSPAISPWRVAIAS